MPIDYSEESLKKVVPCSRSMYHLFKNLGSKSPPSRGMLNKVKRMMIEFDIDYSHFSSKAHHRERTKYPRINKNCPCCGGKFETRKGHPKEKEVCSRKCSNIYFAEKRMTPETKSKIKNGIKRFLKSTHPNSIIENKQCIICGEIFKPHSSKSFSKCCSRKCGQIYQHGSLPLTQEEVLIGIKKLSDKGDFQKRKASSKLVNGAINNFGSWNKAIEQSGFIPNKSTFQKNRIKCKDGHIADSFSEKIIDDFLFENKIAHKIHKKYSSEVNYISDFYLEDFDTWVEYFGLYEIQEKYTEDANRKILFCKENKMKLVSIFPKDLYPINNLNIIFKNFIKI